MELGFSPIITNTFTGYSHVNTFANLPSAASYPNQYFIVDNPSGVWLINRKEAGFYKSNGTTWNFVGSSVDMTSLSDGTTAITASPIILQGTNGITTASDAVNNKITLSGSALPQISTGSGAPASTPAKIGNIYIDTTNYKTYVSKGASSSSDWIKQNGSYSLFGICAYTATVTASTTYYFGSYYGSTLESATANNRIYVNRSGTITKCYADMFCAGLGNTVNSSLYIRVNDTTDYLVSNALTSNFYNNRINNTSLNIPINENDYFSFKWVTPAWSTAPTGVKFKAQVGIDL